MAENKGNREFFEVYRSSPIKGKATPQNEETSQKKRVVQSDDAPIKKEEKKHNNEADVEDGKKQVVDVIKPLPIKPVTRKPAYSSKRLTPGIPKYRPGSWARKTTKTEEAENLHDEKGATEDTPVHKEGSFSKITGFLKKDGVHLSQETIIICVVAGTFLAIACFFIGYKVGHNKGVVQKLEVDTGTELTKGSKKKEKNVNSKTEKQIKEKEPFKLFSKKEDNKNDISKIEKSKEDLWTLRIISYKNSRQNFLKATTLSNAVKKMTGTHSFVAKTGKELIVCVGKFKGDNDPKLAELQIKMSSLVYENKKQFKGCYPVKLK